MSKLGMLLVAASIAAGCGGDDGSGNGGVFEISGSVCGDGKLNFGATQRATGVTSTFQGDIQADGSVSGTYQSTGGSSGTFSGQRSAGGGDGDGGSGTQLTAEGYGNACEDAQGCAVVYPGNVCGCSCSSVALSQDEATRWNQRASELRAECDEVLDCAACPDEELTCEGGACGVAGG